jgi:hypothetical protein
MKIELISRDNVTNILEFVTYINKSDNMTAIVKQDLTIDGYRIIEV